MPSDRGGQARIIPYVPALFLSVNMCSGASWLPGPAPTSTNTVRMTAAPAKDATVTGSPSSGRRG